MFIIPFGNVADIVGQMRDYMYESGIAIREANLKDTSPYAIMKGGSSINYRTEPKTPSKRRKYPASGILFCCNENDYNLLNSIDGIKTFPHKEKNRPYAVFIPDNKLDEAIEQLKKNPQNVR